MILNTLKAKLLRRIGFEQENYGRLYLVIAIPAVLGFAFLTPPFHGPDEDAHFIRAYSIASGTILPQATSGGVGVLLPAQIKESINDVSYSPNIRGSSSLKHGPLQTVREANDAITKPNDKIFYDTSATSSYNPLSYLPAVLGILPIQLFDGPPLIAMYLARIVTALLTCLLFYIAIRIYPGRKIVPWLLFLLPMLLFQQSVVSVDGISYAILAVFVSLVAKLYIQNSITVREWVTIGGVALTLCFMKPLIFLFIPLILVLLKKNPGAVAGIVASSIVALMLWFLLIGNLYKEAPQPVVATGADTEKQIEYLTQRPLRAIRVAWNTYTTTYSDSQSRGLIGTFGSADTPLPLWVTGIFVLALGIGLIFNSDKTKKNIVRSNRQLLIITTLIAVIYFVGINASMYVAYSPVGFDIFYGVQGRYFIPILLLLPIMVLGRSIYLSRRDSLSLRFGIVIAISGCVVISLLVVLQRYYLYTP